jgi:hypothetical protein
MGAVEGTPMNSRTGYTCQSGPANETLVSHVASDQGVLGTAVDAVPPFGGMGHLMLSPYADASYDASSTSAVSLLVASNFRGTSVSTDGCGYDVPCGDAKLGFVKLGSSTPDPTPPATGDCKATYNIVAAGYPGTLSIPANGLGAVNYYAGAGDEPTAIDCSAGITRFVRATGEYYTGTYAGGVMSGTLSDPGSATSYTWNATAM